MNGRVLIAGVGNIFFGDDGYGVEAAHRLAEEPFPPNVRVEDYGIRGMHLAFEILSGYDLVILVDAVSRGGEPGTLYVIEPDLDATFGAPDAHSMELQNVFTLIKQLPRAEHAQIPEILVVGCEPTGHMDGIGLSDTITGVIGDTIRIVHDLVRAREAA